MRNFKGVSGLGVGIFILLLAVFLVVGNQAGIFAGMFAMDGFPTAACHLTSAPSLSLFGI
jgi:hypothetical protein